MAGEMDFRILNPASAAQAATMMRSNPLTSMLATQQQMATTQGQELTNQEAEAKLPYVGANEKAKANYMDSLGEQAKATAAGTNQQNALQTSALLLHAAQGLKSLTPEQRLQRWPQLRPVIQPMLPGLQLGDQPPNDQELDQFIANGQAFISSLTSNPTAATVATGGKIGGGRNGQQQYTPEQRANANANADIMKSTYKKFQEDFNDANNGLQQVQIAKNAAGKIPEDFLSKGIASLSEKFGSPTEGSQALKDLTAASKAIAGSQRRAITGVGATSDKDMEQLQKAVGLEGNSRETTTHRAEVLEAGMLNKRNMSLAGMQWLRAGGNPDDFAKAWLDYRNTYSIFDKTAPSFDDYLQAKNISPQQVSAQGQQSSLFMPSQPQQQAQPSLDPTLQKRIDALPPDIRKKYGF